MSLEEKDPELVAVVERARKAAEELNRSGAWTKADDARLDALFEQAAVAALRVPALSGRSRVLRRLVVRFVPTSFRPMMKKAVPLIDTTLRALYRLKANRNSK